MKNRMTDKAARGQTIQTDYGRDNSSHKVKNPHGAPMGGSVTNLAHSLPGTVANQEGTGKNKPNKFS
jgi:hypothetical protein